MTQKLAAAIWQVLMLIVVVGWVIYNQRIDRDYKRLNLSQRQALARKALYVVIAIGIVLGALLSGWAYLTGEWS